MDLHQRARAVFGERRVEVGNRLDLAVAHADQVALKLGDAPYTAIRMLCDAALSANGYRSLTSRPDRHQTAIQTLPLTLGLAPATVQVLDALRRQRHPTEYLAASPP